MELQTKESTLRELVSGFHGLYSFIYDAGLRLIDSNCPHADLIDQLLHQNNQPDIIEDYLSLHKNPLFLTNDLGMLWVLVFEESDDKLIRIHILGPLFPDDEALRNLRKKLGIMELSPLTQAESLRVYETFPVIPRSQIMEYAIMLHYCVTGTWLSFSDIHYRDPGKAQDVEQAEVALKNIHGTYQLEQDMLRAVREGDLNYRKVTQRLARSGQVGKLSKGNSLRQTKNELLTCAVLFSRAAIEGGLNPELALSLTDYYFQSIEASSDLSELIQTNFTMQEDFVTRVHRCRTNSVSKLAADCIDYIDMHITEELTLSGLAKWLNYSEGYLSRHFKKELGTTFKEYVSRKRLERAGDLLISTDQTVVDISESLRFCSQSYFAAAFRKQYGVSPSEWREHKKLSDKPC